MGERGCFYHLRGGKGLLLPRHRQFCFSEAACAVGWGSAARLPAAGVSHLQPAPSPPRSQADHSQQRGGTMMRSGGAISLHS
eukprot:scaffold6726_cov89-Isochrysis_galbana.AAC.1